MQTTPRPLRRALGPVLALALALAAAPPAAAKIELVTLPERAGCQLTIYNSENLTLVRDERELTFRKGVNRIEFSWENTLIDPTSVAIEPMAGAPPFTVVDTVFPPRVANTLVWNIESPAAGKVPVRISYFTSGITWSADYGLVLDAGEKAATLTGCVTVANGSGEDYENSQVRLIVGKVHLVEKIDALARGQALRGAIDREERRDLNVRFKKSMAMPMAMPCAAAPVVQAKKEIVKESLAEYFIYSVEGRETVENTWSKRLPSLAVDALPVTSVFKHEDFRLGPEAVRFITFKNDKASKMGKEPIPNGVLRVMKVDATGNLQYLGQTEQKYVPVDGTVEVNLGPDREVKVEIALVDYRIDNFRFNHTGDPSGWDTFQTYRVRVRNFKSNPVALEMKRRIGGKFEVEALRADGSAEPFVKEDRRTILFKREVPAATDVEFTYTVRVFNGDNADGR